MEVKLRPESQHVDPQFIGVSSAGYVERPGRCPSVLLNSPNKLTQAVFLDGRYLYQAL